MSNYDADNNRPGDLLDECLSRYGLDKKRNITGSVLCYYRTCHWNDDDHEWVAHWHLGGADSNPETALIETFQQIMPKLIEDSRNDRREKSTHFDALVLVASGEGKYIVKDLDGRDFHDLNAEQQDEIRKDLIEHNAPPVLPGGTAPTRVVSIITLEGIATDLTVFVEGQEPNVQRIEQWYRADSGDDELPEPNGPLENAMLSMFTFTQLLRETIHTGRDLSLSSVLRTATEIPESRGGMEMSGQLLQMIGSAMRVGLFTSDDARNELFDDDDD